MKSIGMCVYSLPSPSNTRKIHPIRQSFEKNKLPSHRNRSLSATKWLFHHAPACALIITVRVSVAAYRSLKGVSERPHKSIHTPAHDCLSPPTALCTLDMACYYSCSSVFHYGISVYPFDLFVKIFLFLPSCDSRRATSRLPLRFTKGARCGISYSVAQTPIKTYPMR